MITEEMVIKVLKAIYKTPFKIAVHTKYKELLKEHLTEVDKQCYYEGYEIRFMDDVPEDQLVKWDERDILNNFANKISKQKDLPGEYNSLVNKNFWELM